MPVEYDPNQEVTVNASSPMPSGVGSGDVRTETKTCQETLRQLGLASLTSVTQSSNVVDGGIRESRLTQGSTSVQVKGTGEAPASAVTPSIGADAAPEGSGVATGSEEKLGEELQRGFDKLRDLLEDLDVTITVKTVDNGKEIRIRSSKGESAAVPTSEETHPPVEILPSVRLDVHAPAPGASGTVRLTADTGAEKLVLASIGETERATAGETGTASVNVQAKNEVEQKGIGNIYAGLQISVSLGPIFNVQTNI